MSYRGVVELEPTDPRVTSHLPDGRPIGAAPADVLAELERLLGAREAA